VISPADWEGQPIPIREWYVADLIPMRQVTILSGDGGVGKSLLALQIAAAGSMEVDTLGLAPMGGRALYLGAEDEADEFQRRLFDIVGAHDRYLKHLSNFRLIPLAGQDALLSVPDRSGKMEPTGLWRAITDYAKDFRPRIIVLDTVADLFGGEEIKRGQARQFIGMLRQLAIDGDCAIILLAHPSVAGMTSGSGSSGSTAWNNSVRSRLYLTRPDSKDADPDLRILKTMKSNYGVAGDEIKLRWKNGTFVLDDGKPQAGETMLAARAERIFCDLLSMFNRQGRKVCHVPGTTYAPAVMAKLPEAEGVPKARFVTAMNALLKSGEVKIVVEGPPSKPRQRLILAAEDFGPKD
jgi:RecA-family ATPase